MKESVRLSDHTIIQVAKQQVSCGLSNEAVILNLQNGIYYGLNPVGARIWELLQQPRAVGEIRFVLLREFEVEADRCTQDLENILRELLHHGLIEIRDVASTQISSPLTN